MNSLLFEQLLQNGALEAAEGTTAEQLLMACSDVGLPVKLIEGGVVLSAIVDPLCHEIIESHLHEAIGEHSLTIHNYIDSTNDYLSKTITALGSPSFCLAEYQTKGHGRRGGQWFATYGQDLCCSIGWPLSPDYQVSGVESLLIGLALVSILERQGLDKISVKWPNDIMVNGRKIAGILLEQKFINKTPILIVGIGLNLSNQPPIKPTGNYQVTSIESEIGICERNSMAAMVLEGVAKILSTITPQLNAEMLSRWERYDFLQGKDISIQQETVYKGRYLGINPHGRLLLNVGDQVRQFSSGHITEIAQ